MTAANGQRMMWPDWKSGEREKKTSALRGQNCIFLLIYLHMSNICSTFATAKAGLDPEQVILSE
jgi:hypothetical protein